MADVEEGKAAAPTPSIKVSNGDGHTISVTEKAYDLIYRNLGYTQAGGKAPAKATSKKPTDSGEPEAVELTDRADAAALDKEQTV